MKRRAEKDEARDSDVEGIKPWKEYPISRIGIRVFFLGRTRTDGNAVHAIVILALNGIKPYRSMQNEHDVTCRVTGTENPAYVTY
jgi:hypothetical protein